METTTALGVTFVVAGGLSLARSAVAASRVLRDLPDDPADAARAVSRARTRMEVAVGLGLIVLWAVPPLVGDAHVGTTPRYLVLCWAASFALVVAHSWISAGLLRPVRSPEWSRGDALRVGLTLPLLVWLPILVGWSIALGLELAGFPTSGASAPLGAACVLAALLAGDLTAIPTLRLLGRPAPLTGPGYEAFVAQAGGGPLPPVQVVPAGRAEANLAFTLRIWDRPRILVARHVLASFPPEEVTSVLLHELGHVQLDHLRRQELLLIGGTTALCLCLMPFGLLNAASAALCVFVVAAYWLPRLSQRHELEADRFAAQASGDAGALASALRRLHASNLVAEDRQGEDEYASHPDLKRRLEALASGSCDELPPSPDQVQKSADLAFGMLALAAGCFVLGEAVDPGWSGAAWTVGSVLALLFAGLRWLRWSRARRAGHHVSDMPEKNREWRWRNLARGFLVAGLTVAIDALVFRPAVPHVALALALLGLASIVAGLGLMFPYLGAWRARRRAERAA